MSILLSYALLTIASVSYMSASRRLEHLRLIVSGRHVSTMLGVFTFAGVVLLPIPISSLLVVTVYAAAWPTFRAAGMPLNRWIYNAGTGMVACLGASLTLRTATPPVVAITGGIVIFIAINFALVATAIVAARHTAALAMLRNPRTYISLATTQVLGAAVGELMAWHQLVGLAVLPALYAFHLWSARGTVKDTKAFDPVTGLWSEEAWKVQAADLIAEGEYVIVVLADDNDSRGRPSVTADVIRGCLRAGDPIGRYGESQIVAVSVVGVAVCGLAIADRIQGSLARAGANTAHGCRTASRESLSEMLMVAGSNLMAERDRAATASRG